MRLQIFMLLSRGCFCYVIRGGGLKLAAYHPCLPNCQAAPRSRASFLEKAANHRVRNGAVHSPLKVALEKAGVCGCIRETVCVWGSISPKTMEKKNEREKEESRCSL